MKLSELIIKVGDENVKVQSLEKTATYFKDSLRSNKSQVTFNTKLGLFSSGDYCALVVWIPKKLLPVIK